MKLILLSLLSLFCFSGCTSTESADTITLVSTTTMLTDLATVIGGDCIEVVGLMGSGIDPHLYQASASDLATLDNANIILYNGLHLEGKLGDVLDGMSQQGKWVIIAQDGLDPTQLLSDDAYDYDPHIWFDVSLWKDVASHLATQLSDIDPENQDTYRSNVENYLLQLDDLETYITARINQVPESQRVLITAHDAFGYFGRAYGFQVLGLQGISTQSEASTSHVSQLADYIVQHEIKAIFVETSVSDKSIQALQEAVQASGFSVAIGGELYSDSLGDSTSGHGSYIATFTANVDTIVSALTQ